MVLSNQAYCLGDIVRYIDSYYRIYSISCDNSTVTLGSIGSEVEFFKGDLIEVYIGYIQPALLTDSFLLKLGFSENESLVSCYKRDSVGIIWDSIRKKWHFKHYSSVRKMQCCEHFYISYVHQLQWLLRILGYNEIEYNEV